jgi:hypothetical protein
MELSRIYLVAPTIVGLAVNACESYEYAERTFGWVFVRRGVIVAEVQFRRQRMDAHYATHRFHLWSRYPFSHTRRSQALIQPLDRWSAQRKQS